MILAGQRLNEARASQYDFASEDEIDEDASDPTRRGNFDLADASQMAMETEMSLRDQALEADKALRPFLRRRYIRHLRTLFSTTRCILCSLESFTRLISLQRLIP